MQVFRNNRLSIADVNAMTKAKGQNGVLDRFSPGDSVQVKLDNNRRVIELRLKNGKTFIRQANGSYIYR